MKKRKKTPIPNLYLFANGNVCAFNASGEQVVPLQLHTIKEVFSKAFPKYDFSRTRLLMQATAIYEA